MTLTLMLPLVLSATALAGAGLATFLLWRAHRVAGAVPLAMFLVLVGCWAVGLAVPGPTSTALMALAPVAAAFFLHFCLRLTGRGDGLLPWSYSVAATATGLAWVGGVGRFEAWGELTLFRYDGLGLIAGGATLALAGLGFALLMGAWRRAEGTARRRIALVLAACLLGLGSVAGLAFPLLGIQLAPWPLLLLPLYLALLAYGALRYDLAAGLREEALQSLQRRQAEAERQHLAELGTLAATIAHDLRNPMNIIAMAAADTDLATRTEIRSQLTRMDALVRDLLEYAKPWVVDPVMLNLADIVGAVVRGRAVVLDIPPNLILRADPLRLTQALENLLANAIGARIQVIAEGTANAVLIHICDDGPGIPDDIRATLFQPFVSRSPGGTGLGLAIIAKVMKAHGGSVSLSARPGWTTCFTLRFPS